MLNAANLALVAFARYWATLSGQVLAIFIMSIAAAEAAVGLGVMIALFRNKDTLNMDDIKIMKG
jgi:NADH-quinone oxidoreductase subunit K